MIAFYKNVSRYLSELTRLFSNIIRNKTLENQQTSYEVAKDSARKSIYNLIDMELLGSEESNISAYLNKTSTPFGQYLYICPPENQLNLK